MYNMDISIFGYKLNIEILILIGVIYFVLVGHTLCGCCNFYSLIEGNTTLSEQTNKLKQNIQSNMPTQTTSKEGFVGANTNYGESSAFNLSDTMPVDTSSWSAQNLTVVSGQPLSEGVKKILARPNQQLPLPEGEMLLFANTPFKPECCPNTYSNSSGCACMSSQTFNFLKTRAGNNVPYSEY